MNEQARTRALRDALAAAQRKDGGAGRYRLTQRMARTGRGLVADRPRPLEFDESGFPIAQKRPSFAERVARLLSPQ